MLYLDCQCNQLVFRILQQSGNTDLNSVGNGIITAAIGAFIAYYFWEYYRKPFLYIDRIERKRFFKSNQEYADRFRIKVRNLGKRAASDCEGQLWMIGKTSNSVYIINQQLGWANIRANVFGDNSADYNRQNEIGPNDIAALDLMSYNIQEQTLEFSDWVDTGDTQVVKLSGNRIDLDKISGINGDLLISDDFQANQEEGDLYSSISQIHIEELRKMDWFETKIRIRSTNTSEIQDGLCMYTYSYLDDHICLELRSDRYPRSIRARIPIIFRKII